MTPITLFDKSFLQSLTLDESVWFDHFFITNICPIFYVETLADLGKPSGQERDPEAEVRIIAEKFPDMQSFPCAHHIDLAHASLLGYDIPMTGQIPLANGRLVSLDGKTNVISESSPVSDAFSRWQNGEYDFVERQYARLWRNQLSKVNLSAIPELFAYWDSFNKPCKSLEMARDLALDFINSNRIPLLRLEICLTLLEVPMYGEKEVRSRWVELGYPSVSEFAPFAAFVISIIIFFHLSIRSGLISPHRVSNLTDIAYLFYLPFSMIFVSSDRLHKRVTQLFLRSNQEFIWGPDLKSSLQEMNIYYSLFPDSEKEKGIWALAPTPPMHIPSLISSLWDRHLLNWREKPSKITSVDSRLKFEDIKEIVRQMEKAPTLRATPGAIETKDIHSASITRKVRKEKGAWSLLPKNIRN